MLSGTRAFPGEDVTDTIVSVLSKEPDFDALPATVPARVTQTLRVCLRKDAKQRAGDIRDVRLALDGAFDTAAVAAPVVSPAPPRAPWRRALPVALTIVACALVGVAAWRLRPEPPPPPVFRAAFQLPDGQAWGDPNARALAVSPDGARLVYAANGRLYRRELSALEATPIPGSEGATSPVFSPDGQSLAFFAANELRRLPLAGGLAAALCPASPPMEITWGPDGIVFDQGGVGVLRVSPSGGVPETLVTLTDERTNAAQMLPGGTHLLLSVKAASDNWDRGDVVVQALGTQVRTVLVKGASAARYLPTGHLLYARGGDVFAVPFDVRRLQVGAGQATPVVPAVRRVGIRAGIAQFSVSDSGTLVFIPGPATFAWVQPLSAGVSDATGRVTPLKLPPGSYEMPRVSPDGRRLAVAVTDGSQRYVAIYDLDGQAALRRLTFGKSDSYPIWSPDSQRVTFASNDGESSAIFRQRADGLGTAERLTPLRPSPSGTFPVPSSWSTGDATLLFHVIDLVKQVRSLWTWSRDGRQESQVAGVGSSDGIYAVFSPDGRWVAYAGVGTAGGAPSVYVQPFPATGTLYQLPRPGQRPVWSPDGKALYYQPSPDRLTRVPVTTQPAFAFGNPVRVPVPVLGYGNFDVMPDGRILVLQPEPGAAETAAPEIRIVVNWFEELMRLVPTN